MNKYYAYIVGEGEGCDYTIGCNIRLSKIGEFKNISIAHDTFIHDFNFENIKSVEILEVSKTLVLNVENIKRALSISRYTEEKLKKIEEERRLLKELKEKYES